MILNNLSCWLSVFLADIYIKWISSHVTPPHVGLKDYSEIITGMVRFAKANPGPSWGLVNSECPLHLHFEDFNIFKLHNIY